MIKLDILYLLEAIVVIRTDLKSCKRSQDLLTTGKVVAVRLSVHLGLNIFFSHLNKACSILNSIKLLLLFFKPL